MGEDVTVPDVESGDVEMRLDPRYPAGIDEHRVLQSGLVRIRRSRCSNQNGRLGGEPVWTQLEILPVDHFEGYLVHVDRVGIRSEIVELPDLCRVEVRVFGDRLHPLLGNAESVISKSA